MKKSFFRRPEKESCQLLLSQGPDDLYQLQKMRDEISQSKTLGKEPVRPTGTETINMISRKFQALLSKTGIYDSGGLQSGHSSKQSLSSFPTAKISAVPLQVWQTNMLTHSIFILFLT
jgi:hypothetical protein